MSLSVENVMQELTPMLSQPRGRPRKDDYSCGCGETHPEQFGANKRTCLPCRREYHAHHRLKLKREADFRRAMETLKLINSFPTMEALCR